MNDFRSLHRHGDPLVLPNAWDVASARMLVMAGFPAVGTTSLGVAAVNGLPDGEDATGGEALRLTQRIAGLPCHVSVDIERGSVAQAVAVAAAGAAGINVEDAMGPAGPQVRLIRAVKREVPGLFVNARTDTHWQRRGDLGETVRRVRAYADAGADGIFVPGLREPRDIEAVVRAVDLPLNVLHDPCGLTVAELAALGVRRVSTGSLLFRVALAATVEAARAVRDGTPVRTTALPAYADLAAPPNAAPPKAAPPRAAPPRAAPPKAGPPNVAPSNAAPLSAVPPAAGPPETAAPNAAPREAGPPAAGPPEAAPPKAAQRKASPSAATSLPKVGP